ncbi:hypothetical protein E3Q18_03207 [Wallemia mellicola]|nr:hypothetical protein E3Q18_03207 [Wallemia mellicola]
MQLLRTAAILSAAGFASAAWDANAPDVVASGTMGVTNPPAPTMGTDVNQSSEARLVSINSIDDFCFFGPKEAGKTIGDTEAEQVAWCTQPRNNARVIPDGTITSAHFVKTDAYVQVRAQGDFTKIGVQDGDYGGELDPHGATGDGNPVGGNITSNVSGSDVSYQEWMEFLSYNQVCIRACIAGNETFGTPVMCEHKLDEMGCDFVMPGSNDEGFDTCEGDVAYPPGVYPVDGGFSTFAQRFTGTYSIDGTPTVYTVGVTETPSAAAFTPSSSNCVTQSSIAANNVSVSGASSSSSSSAANPESSSSSGSSSDSDSGSSGESSTNNGATSANTDGDSGASTFTGVATVSAVALAVLAIAL